MNTSPAVTEADLRSDNSAPNTIDVQAFNAFWRLYLGDIYICLFASIYGDQSAGMMVLSYSFTPQTRTFEHKYTASLLLDDDEPHSLIVSSQSGRLAVSGYQGVYGSDIHRILRDGLNDTLCHKVLPDGIDCFGMDPYSGAILWISKQSLSTEIGISYFD
ncbi:hypothetical protein DFH11DRAFT_1174277 [Phellopilus nigrolimitatus]|nr:hypothetical protein DFH11DRAFT_1174277 [Phellopilus nigrolimitatus]